MSSAPANILEADATVAHRYRITGYLGNRGFGQVYQADDSAMDQRVVLMRLHREFSDPEIRENFFETRATAAVEDPRIVDISDYGEDLDGRLFLVMPWIEEARALDELVASGRSLGWPRIKAIVREIAEALRAAHDKGVLHGGLDLSRVLLDKDDHVHVVDFGLAPALTRPGARATTNTSKLPGNPHYLAPEQIRGEGSNTRSDIYALGVMLWELISGAPPFVGDPLTVTRAHLDRALPELARRGAPAEIEPLLHLALTKDASERIETMGEFLVLLDAMPAGAPAARPEPAPKPAPKPVATPAPTPPKPVELELVEPASPAPAPASPAPAPASSSPAPPTPAPPPPSSEAAAAKPAQSGSALRLQPAPDPEPEPEPVVGPAPLAKPKRGLRKLELAILIFLGFDLLIVVAWLLFGRSPDPEIAQDDAAERAPAEPASDAPAAKEEKGPSAAAAPADEALELEDEDPSQDPASPAKSANEAIAELMPEPESVGPTRELAASLDDSDFREVMVASRDKILDACLETRMRRTLKVSLKVDPSGKVSFARVVGGLSETQLGRCVVKQTYRMQFPATESGGTHVYTLRLR